MERKLLFDEDAAKYERMRPKYGAQVFRDILAYSGAGAGAAVAEVGPGTGQATLPFLEAGCKVTAVEIGTNLAAHMMHKFSDYPNLRMVNLPFEQFRCAENSFDLLVSATAFHWIPAEVGYRKAFELLKPGGAAALFWNRPGVDRPDDPLHQRIQAVYDEVVPHMSRKAQPEDREATYAAVDDGLRGAGFADVERRLYHNTREFGAEEYVELLDTYSDHRALDGETKRKLYDGIRGAIEACGGRLVIHDTVDLHLGRKR